MPYELRIVRQAAAVGSVGQEPRILGQGEPLLEKRDRSRRLAANEIAADDQRHVEIGLTIHLHIMKAVTLDPLAVGLLSLEREEKYGRFLVAAEVKHGRGAGDENGSGIAIEKKVALGHLALQRVEHDVGLPQPIAGAEGLREDRLVPRAEIRIEVGPPVRNGAIEAADE